MDRGQLKIQLKLFLGTFTSCEAAGKYFYFILLKLCVFEKTEMQNGSHCSWKGPKTPFCGWFGPKMFKLVNRFIKIIASLSQMKEN